MIENSAEELRKVCNDFSKYIVEIETILGQSRFIDAEVILEDWLNMLHKYSNVLIKIAKGLNNE